MSQNELHANRRTPDAGERPDLSVILVTPGAYDTIRATMRQLRRQTIADRLEVLIAAPSRDGLGLDDAEWHDFQRGFHHGFYAVRVVEVGPIEATGEARAACVRQAAAPVIALAEDHSYPEPEWAAALVAAHREPWAAVGPAMINANPATMTSWADLLLDFGRWLDPVPAGVVDDIPWHNGAYKRDLLLAYGADLGKMLEAAGALHADLRARGHQLYLEPAAKTHHLNISRPAVAARSQFHSGRLFGAVRARQGAWAALRRLLYIAGAPLIPPLRLRRVLREARRPGRATPPAFRLLPSLLLGVVAHTLGEAVGYARGGGDARRHKTDFELVRRRFLTARDRREDAAR